MINANLKNRLENYKFHQALQYLGTATEEERAVIEALARLLGNSGWLCGDIDVIVNFVVVTLCDDAEKKT